jgi:ribonuclease Z
MDRKTGSERAAAPRFRVTLLGTGNPPPVMARFSPSTLVEAGEHTLVFDAGRGARQGLAPAAMRKPTVSHMTFPQTIEIWCRSTLGIC